MPPAPPNATIWVITYESSNYEMEPSSDTVGAYTTEARAEIAAYLFLRTATRKALYLMPTTPHPPRVEDPGHVDSRFNHVYRRKSPTVVEVVLDWEGRFMEVRYEELTVVA
jgi:hypothetical protein